MTHTSDLPDTGNDESTSRQEHGPRSLNAPCVVLVNPQLGENIGTAARAMANFGLRSLHIVDPRDGWPNERAVAAASGADHILEQVLVFDRLETALADRQFVYATTARPRGMTKEVMSPEQAARDMRARTLRGEKVAILFGRERWGLSNDEIALADVIISAPVDPQFASINIAQAVLLVGYEWYKHEATTLGQTTRELDALDGPGLKMPYTFPANKDELYRLFEHLEGTLDAAGFFKSLQKKPIMIRNMRNLLSRTAMTDREVRSVRGMITALSNMRWTGRSEDKTTEDEAK